MPWLTPDDDPALVSRVVFVPDGVEWEACFWGAFLELADAENWEEYGTITPEDAARRWFEAIVASQEAN